MNLVTVLLMLKNFSADEQLNIQQSHRDKSSQYTQHLRTDQSGRSKPKFVSDFTASDRDGD